MLGIETRMRSFKVLSVLLLGATAVVSALMSLANATQSLNPIAATHIPFASGFAYAGAARLLLTSKITAESGDFPDTVDSQTLALARSGFLREPLTDDALAIYGLAAAAHGNEEKARQLMSAAVGVNKRSTLGNLWLAQSETKDLDVDGLLAHYDNLLRINPSARAELLRRMAMITVAPVFRKPFTKLLRTSPPWVEDFWAVAPAAPGAITAVAEMRIGLADSKVHFSRENDSSLAVKLIEAGRMDLAQKIYHLRAPKGHASLQLVKNSDFSQPSYLPPVDWETYASGEMGGAIRKDRRGFIFSVAPGATGAIARQSVTLNPGSYRLTSQLISSLDDGTESSVRIILQCIVSGRNEISLPLRKGTHTQNFSVASSCRDYWLIVDVAAGDLTDGFDAQLDRLSIVRSDGAG